jgi:hypothetical protein
VSIDTESQDERIARHVREHGWHCVHVFAQGAEQDPFTYTIGLHERFAVPEVLVFGLEQKQAQGVLAACVDKVRRGGRLLVGLRDGDILNDGYGVVFKPLRPECFGEYVGVAMRYYHHAPFAALVMFLPDREHRFAWDRGYQGPAAQEALRIV